MTRGEWVLLRGLLGMLGLLSFAFGVDSASLSGLNSANETEETRVCAYLCDVGLASKSCEVFCTSRRQFTIQSSTVAAEKDVVVSVGETRRDACPTLCRHGMRVSFCTCDTPKRSDYQVPGVDLPWEKICTLFCEDKHRLFGCPECPEEDDHSQRINEQPEKIDNSVWSAKMSRHLMNAIVTPAPRGSAAEKSDVTGERDGVDAEVDFLEIDNAGWQRGIEVRSSYDNGEFDWDKFCEIECARGNGGLACKCDIIP